MGRVVIILLFFIALPVSGIGQSEVTYWKVENQFGEDILLTIEIDWNKKTFVAHTRKDALKEIAGPVTYLAARTTGFLKYAEIVHAEGKVTFKMDTVFTDGTFTYLNKTLRFSAKSYNNLFKGYMADDKKIVYYLDGERIPSARPLHDYAAILGKAFSLTEKHFYDPGLIRSSDWRNFKSKVIEQQSKIADDNELYSTVYWMKRGISEVNFEIKKKQKTGAEPNQMKTTIPVEVKKGTALIDLNRLPDTADDAGQLFSEIKRKGFRNLVIDARGRKNTGLNSALLLIGHLSVKNGLWGAYLTAKWAQKETTIPKPDQFEKTLKDIRQFDEGNNELLKENGCFMKVTTSAPVFSGKVYLLINKRTSGVAEALAVWIRNEKAGTVAGQKSSGSPMLTLPVPIDELYYLPLQVARFCDSAGKMWVNEGVEPDIKVGNEDSLGFLLKMLE